MENQEAEYYLQASVLKSEAYDCKEYVVNAHIRAIGSKNNSYYPVH